MHNDPNAQSHFITRPDFQNATDAKIMAYALSVYSRSVCLNPLWCMLGVLLTALPF